MNHTYRKFSGWVGIVAIVFAQLALSAYACPMLFDELGDRTDAASVSSPMSDYPDFVLPNLCQKHCADGQQNINDTPQPQGFALLGGGFIVTLVIDLPAPIPATVLSNSLLHATSPPLAIQHCCFRI